MPTNNTENVYTHEYEDTGAPIPGTKIGYDNTETGLEATNMQEAIDELDSKIKASDEADEISYDNTDSGLTAENVQDAIDEVVGITKDKYLLIGKDTFTATLTTQTMKAAIGDGALNTAITAFLDTLAADEYIDILRLQISGSDMVDMSVAYGDSLLTKNSEYSIGFAGVGVTVNGFAMCDAKLSNKTGVASYVNTSTGNTTPIITRTPLTNDESVTNRTFKIRYNKYKKV